MPDLFFTDMVREISRTSGTGAFVLDGPSPGHRAFAGAVPAGRDFHYAIQGITHEHEWEIGIGQIDMQGELVRAPLASSDGNALVDFAAGAKSVALIVAADWFAQVESRSEHSHSIAEIDGLTSALAGKQAAGSYASAMHGHSMTDVGGLNEALAGKQAVGSYANANHSHNNYWPSDASGNWVVTTGRAGIGAANPRSRLDVNGIISGGFGADIGTGVLDWNDVSNARSGQGTTLLNQSAINGPPQSGFYHPFTFEYARKDGLGNMTQFAVPYQDGRSLFLRIRFSGVWGGWRCVLTENLNAEFAPATDGLAKLGSASLRFDRLFAVNGVQSTSDAREKTWRGPLTEAEYRAALAIVDELGFFQWREAIAAKGKDQARWHFGVRAQKIWAIMADHRLIAPLASGEPPDCRYGFLCHDAWPDEYAAPLQSESGVPLTARQSRGRGKRVRRAGQRFGVRYDQLNAFLIAALAQRQAAVEAELAALRADIALQAAA
jgi:hypothetical protein